MKTRRKFLYSTLTLGLASSLPTFALSKEKQLVHHVYFWLKNPSVKDDLNKLVEGIATLRTIPIVRQFRIGIPAATIKREVVDDSYAVSLFTVFDDIAGHDEYQKHPIHLKFIEKYSYLWSKVTVYDSIDI